MDIPSIKAAAADSLAAASYPPKKMAAIHTGAALLLSLVLTVVNYLLTRGMDSAAGLSGIGTRTLLSFSQSILSILGSVLLPFWEIGFFCVALKLARREPTDPKTLAEGFRRFGPVSRLLLLELVLAISVVLASTQLALILFMLTPFSEGMLEKLDFALTATAENPVHMDGAALSELLPLILPVYILAGVILLVLGIPLFYRFRMAHFVVMDDPAPGALAAMGKSLRIMQGHCLSLFRLDLSFWWFYAAEFFIALLAYADTLLPLLGIPLPVSGDTAFFIFYGVHLVLQLALAWFCVSYVQTTYAHCYNAFQQSSPTPIIKNPKQLPWS